MPRHRRDRPSRSKGLRTRSGCVNCRARRVKCDEKRPICGACQRRQQDCVFSDLGHGTAHGQDDEQVADDDYRDELQSQPAVCISPHTATSAQVYPSPDGSSSYSAETASLLWFGLLTNNSYSLPIENALATRSFQDDLAHVLTTPELQVACALSESGIVLDETQTSLFKHYVRHLSRWIDLTDPAQSFGTIVASMAVQSKGLMNAILALSSRHASLGPGLIPDLDAANVHVSTWSAIAVRFYHETLQYLQSAMRDAIFLRSDELLAAVLLISTYEMLDSSGEDWDRHLKGVFWIQRSQQINGEMAGLKQRIWWAWLRQDIWAAFKHKRKILSFYKLTRPCSELDFWELANRSFFLLGQCVNYASTEQQAAAETDYRSRIDGGTDLWSSLDEWASYFVPFDRRMPTTRASDDFPFDAIWVHPPAASSALQAHHFSRILMLENRPATGGLRELTARESELQHSVAVICGLAYCTTDAEAAVISLQCLFAARPFVKSDEQSKAIAKLIHAHRQITGWPHNEV